MRQELTRYDLDLCKGQRSLKDMNEISANKRRGNKARIRYLPMRDVLTREDSDYNQ
jgi:hypothetical protein